MTVLDAPGSPVHYRRNIPRVTQKSPGNARTWAHTLLQSLGVEPDTVDLAVTELTTNVWRYAAGPAQIALCVNGELIEVACTDWHPETADAVRPGDADDDALTGRGLWMLALLALDGITVEASHQRKRVAVRIPIGAN